MAPSLKGRFSALFYNTRLNSKYVFPEGGITLELLMEVHMRL